VKKLEIGKTYKISYKDGNYTLIAKGKLLEEQEHMIQIEDYKDGKIYIGKPSIHRIREVEE